jgi:Delta7-sterol 5-desaturase
MIEGLLNVGFYFITFIVFTMINSLWNFYIHSKLEFIPRSIVQPTPLEFIVTSTHHNLHHSKNSGNYGLYLTI